MPNLSCIADKAPSVANNTEYIEVPVITDLTNALRAVKNNNDLPSSNVPTSTNVISKLSDKAHSTINNAESFEIPRRSDLTKEPRKTKIQSSSATTSSPKVISKRSQKKTPSLPIETSALAAHKAARDQRLATARARMAEKKKAWRTEKLQKEYGVSNEFQRNALVAGCKKSDGTADTTAYKRHVVEQSARNYADAAGNHPFIKADGSVDLTAYNRHRTEQSARNYADAAGNHPFHNADGSADVTAYNRHIVEQSARNYTDAAGNHPFRKADGSGDVATYRKNVSQQRQEDDAISALLIMSKACRVG